MTCQNARRTMTRNDTPTRVTVHIEPELHFEAQAKALPVRRNPFMLPDDMRTVRRSGEADAARARQNDGDMAAVLIGLGASFAAGFWLAAWLAGGAL